MNKIIFSFFILVLLTRMIYAQTETQFELNFLIKTQSGEIKIKLDSETPKHRGNFVRLVKSGFFMEQYLIES